MESCIRANGYQTVTLDRDSVPREAAPRTESAASTPSQTILVTTRRK